MDGVPLSKAKHKPTIFLNKYVIVRSKKKNSETSEEFEGATNMQVKMEEQNIDPPKTQHKIQENLKDPLTLGKYKHENMVVTF
jgi:hypothetical protein